MRCIVPAPVAISFPPLIVASRDVRPVDRGSTRIPELLAAHDQAVVSLDLQRRRRRKILSEVNCFTFRAPRSR